VHKLRELEEDVRSWVWSGLHTEEDIAIEVTHSAYPDKRELEKALINVFQAKREAERTWPAQTDCDLLDKAFEQLRRERIVALHHAGFNSRDGYDEVQDTLAEYPTVSFQGYCFYHSQDLDRVLDGNGLFLAFGGLGEVEASQIGQRVDGILREQGLETDWNGDAQTRILIPHMQWLRRYPPSPFSPPSED